MSDDQRVKSDEIPPAVLEIHKGRPIRLNVKILVPVQDHPNFNFVGKLLGPKGNSLQRLQEATQTRMAILGKGSMRNREKEEELRNSGDSKHAHLHEDLHVDISTFAPAAEAYARIAHAIAEIKRFLVPDYYDDIRQQQLRELAVLNGAKKQQVVSANGKRNGCDSTTPLSSPTTSVNSPPPEATRGTSVTIPQPADSLYPSRTTVMRIDASPSGKNRIPRLQFPFPRTSPAARLHHPGYRRLPLYGTITPEAPNVLIPENEVNIYEDSYHAEIHEPLYEPDFSLISDPESCFDYDGSVLNDHQGRSYERNGCGDCSRTIPPAGVLHRLRHPSVRSTASRAPPRSHPYPLPSYH